jgi:translation initiation factor 2B subunit (eIF-2B alpha/beta/delta family)
VLVLQDIKGRHSKRMVQELTKEKIESYQVSLSSIYTIMPKITKVIISSYAVMADGGILGYSGIFALGMVIGGEEDRQRVLGPAACGFASVQANPQI